MSNSFNKQGWTKNRYEKKYKPAYVALMKVYPFTLDDLDGEEWRWVPDYEGLYQVSSFGRVKSFNGLYCNEKILKPVLHGNGRLIVCLCKRAVRKHFFVHTLVASAFISNPNNKLEIDHIDANSFNNHVSNLRWATSSENTRFAFDLGILKEGAECSWAKLTNEQVCFIRANSGKMTRQKLAEVFGVAPAVISNVQMGKSYKNAGGVIRDKIDIRVPDETRDEIRQRWEAGERNKTALAREYGVSDTTIKNIINEK